MNVKTTKITQAITHVDNVTTELRGLLETHPEVLPMFVQLAKSTARFCEAMAMNDSSVKFLGSRRKIWELTCELYSGTDTETLTNLYNCILCTKESLKCGVYKTFRPKDIPTFAQTHIAVYQDFLIIFNQHIECLCADKKVANNIQRYAKAVVTELITLMSSKTERQ